MCKGQDVSVLDDCIYKLRFPIRKSIWSRSRRKKNNVVLLIVTTYVHYVRWHKFKERRSLLLYNAAVL